MTRYICTSCNSKFFEPEYKLMYGEYKNCCPICESVECIKKDYEYNDKSDALEHVIDVLDNEIGEFKIDLRNYINKSINNIEADKNLEEIINKTKEMRTMIEEDVIKYLERFI